MDWFYLLLVMVVLAAIVGAAAALLGASIPAPENRSKPPECITDLEQARARAEALAKIAARAARKGL